MLSAQNKLYATVAYSRPLHTHQYLNTYFVQSTELVLLAKQNILGQNSTTKELKKYTEE